MLNELFLIILSISAAASLAAAVIAALSNKIGGLRISARWLCVCWFVLAIRLLIPFTLPVHFFDIELAQIYNSSEISADYEILASEVYSEAAVDVNASEQINISLLHVFVFIWLAGVTACLVWHIVFYMLSMKRMLRWSRRADDEKLGTAQNIAAELNVCRSFDVYVSSEKISPMVMGIFHPVLLLPSDINNEQLEVALRHELIHLRRGDILFRTIWTVVNAVHWFNPVIWLAAKAAFRDTEKACDDEVLAGRDAEFRKAYCRTILDMMSGRSIPFATTFSNKKEDFMMRINNIIDTSKRKSGLILLMFILCISAFSGLVGCKIEDRQTDTAAIEAVIQDKDIDYEQDSKFADNSAGYMDSEMAMAIVNEYRRENDLPELKTDNESLRQIAQMRIEEAMELFSHRRPNGERYYEAFDEVGLSYTYACENLARGQEFAGMVINDWISSPTHLSNILNPNITHMCIICERGKPGTEFENFVYWVYIGYTA